MRNVVEALRAMFGRNEDVDAGQLWTNGKHAYLTLGDGRALHLMAPWSVEKVQKTLPNAFRSQEHWRSEGYRRLA